jgi:hypothetical protein
MKNLVLGSLIALTATQAAGCIIESNGGTEDAFITANWTFQNISNGTTTGCPAGFNTVALYNQATDGGYCDPFDPGAGSTCIDLFDCVNGTGLSSELRPTEYLSWIEVTSGGGGSVYAKSASAYVDVTVADKSFSAQILNDGGYFQFAWNLYGAQSNADLTCAQAGLNASATAGIKLQAILTTATTGDSDIFDCEDGSGITAGYVAGSYDVLIDAVDPDPVGSAPAISAVLGPQNDFENLGTVEIPITGL